MTRGRTWWTRSVDCVLVEDVPDGSGSAPRRQATAAHVEMLAGIRRRFARPTGR